jgi:predicted RNase H-like nuclease (RuvC/YqgF family)
MNPVFHRELAQGVDRYDISVKSRPRMMEQQSVVLSRSAVPAAEQRQHFLAQMIRTVQNELAALSTAAASSHKNENENHTLRQQIEILQGRNRTLEGQLQSNWALGLSDEPPPEYLP